MKWLCYVLGCDTYRERRTHDGVKLVLGLTCRRCREWHPVLVRTREERARLKRIGAIRRLRTR